LPTIELPDGVHEYRCTARTTTIYEQAFYNDPNPRITGDISADIFGKHRFTADDANVVWSEDGERVIGFNFDFTSDNWNAYRRALWAMLRTQAEIDAKHNREVYEVPGYAKWDKEMLEWEPNQFDLSHDVTDEVFRGLFRAGAAAS
jgi:hypothetical protein